MKFTEELKWVEVSFQGRSLDFAEGRSLDSWFLFEIIVLDIYKIMSDWWFYSKTIVLDIFKITVYKNFVEQVKCVGSLFFRCKELCRTMHIIPKTTTRSW